MQEKKIPPLKTQNDFLNWLFEEFKVPESSQNEITKRYAQIPEICDFEYLASCVIQQYTSRDTLPGPKWLMYRFVERDKVQNQKKHIPAVFGTTCEAVQQRMENREAFLSNYQECQNAMRKCMAHYEHITGRKIRRSSLCS